MNNSVGEKDLRTVALATDGRPPVTLREVARPSSSITHRGASARRAPDSGTQGAMAARVGVRTSARTPWERLQALVDWERADRARMRVDLSPEFDLMRRLGNPHRRFRTVHVTGTKGKGSVCALIEAGLLHAGLRAGRYSSPHLEHVTERISLLGRSIAEDDMALALAHALDARDAACVQGSAARDASWFDVVTAAAFWAFARAGVEWAVVEVGLGGRLDSTNVVMSDLAIVTNVGLEHTDVLGNTVTEIAAEKAGIIKPGRPVLTFLGPSDPAGQVVRQTASKLGCECAWVDPAATPGIEAGNLALSRAALNLLGQRGVRSPTGNRPLDEENLPASVAVAARLPGRLEAMDVERFGFAPDKEGESTVRLVLDGAHVGFSLSAVIDELRLSEDHALDPVVLVALGTDKNADDFIARLRGFAARVVCTSLADARRSWPASGLARICRAHGIDSECVATASAGLSRCLSIVPTGSWVLVTGSLYLVGEVRAELMHRHASPAIATRRQKTC